MNLRSGAAASAILNCKKVKRDGGVEGYDYFQNLPDDLIIVIFTKLSSGHGLDTLADVKSLGQCSTVSQRFNSLTSLVPTLSISHRAIAILYAFCPKVLKKFKHIRSLRLEYRSDTKGVKNGAKHIPTIISKAIYDPPHNYSLAVLSATSVDVLPYKKEQYPTRSLITAVDDKNDIILTTQVYASALFHLHHMLLSSIRDHKLLHKVVVTDWGHYESFTLVEEQLVQLRSINTSVAEVQGCHRSGFCNVLSVPVLDGVVLFKNITFNHFEKWQEDSTGRHDADIPQFEGNTGIVCNDALERMLKMEADLSVDYDLVPLMVHENNWV